MRVLWLKSDLLLPLDKGGKLRTWHLMRHLARHHEITYLAFAEPEQMAADGRSVSPSLARGMSEVASCLEVVPRTDAAKGSWQFYADAARHVVHPLPYAVAKYRSARYAARLRELLAGERFDLLVCDFLFPAVNLPASLPCPAVIFTHNVEAEIWRRHAETQTSWIGRHLYGRQHARMLRFERQALGRFDGVLAVSDADRDTFDRLYPGVIRQPVHVVPTGVDTDFFAPQPSDGERRSLVFTGSMDWLPNEDAMTYFCRDILPAIREAVPGVELSIVGRAPTPAVQKLAAEPGVVVTGRVDDVRPYMRDAAVYIVPLRIGGGTRLKIFEAMAMGKAVISTTVGAEGLPVESGQHVLIADAPAAFARGVIRLLNDVEERRRLETAARALVVGRYDWSAVAGELEVALTRYARQPHAVARQPHAAAQGVGATNSGAHPETGAAQAVGPTGR